MLSESEKNLVALGFQVYDHSWKYYSSFLGEPFLLRDFLAYFDGQILYFCAFRLNDIKDIVSAAEIVENVGCFKYLDQVRAINIWGNIDLAGASAISTIGKLRQLEYAKYTGSCDVAIDLERFDPPNNTRWRKARNCANAHGITVERHLGTIPTADHLDLVRRFMLSHALSNVHKHFALSALHMFQHEDVLVFETRDGEKLGGLSFVLRPSPTRAVRLAGFYDSALVKRASDIAMHQIISWAKDQGVFKLHLGYSATPSLLAFKRKWGNLVEMPDFSEIFFGTDEFAAPIASGKFIWRDRTLVG